jgi:Domain of unknown function (DUF4340)
MNTRNFLMFGLVAIVALGAWYVTQRKLPTSELAVTTLYPGLLDHINDAETLTVESNDGKVTVQRTGDQWAVNEFDHYPATVATVKQTLLQLAALKILEAKTSKPEKYAQLGVADQGIDSRGVKVLTKGGATVVDLRVGKARPSHTISTPGHYVRRGGEASAYLVEGELSLGLKATDWVDTSVINLPVERVHQVTVQPHEGAPFTVNKASPEVQLYTLANVPAGQEVRARATVSSIGGMLLDAKFEKVIAATKLAGLTPLAVATVETFDGMTITVNQFEFEAAKFMTFSAAHTPEKALTLPPPATPDPAAKDPGTGAAAPSTALKPEDVAKEVATLNAKLTGWAFVLPDYKSRLMEKKLPDLLKKKEPKSAGTTAE